MLNFLVQLDPGIQSLIVAGLTFLVGLIILKVGELYPPLGEYLGQYKAGIVTWASGLIFNLLQNWLNQVPESWDTVAALAMRLIVEVAAVLVAFALLRRNGVKALQYK